MMTPVKYPKGHEFSFVWLRPTMIFADELYQRKLSATRVNKIAAKFNGDKVNEPKVSYRDGKYWVFDGQHTLAVWQKLYGDKPILCKVYKGMTWLDECLMFIGQDEDVEHVALTHKLRAMYVAKDESITAMVNGAELVGFNVVFDITKAHKADGRIFAVASLARAFNALGNAMYVDMLTALRDAWGGKCDSLNGQIISGLTKFYSTYGGNFNRDDLAKSLSRVRPIDIITNGKAAHIKNGYAREITKAYNVKRRSNRLDIELL